MSIELTREQLHTAESLPLRVTDPDTRREFVLVSAETFDRLRRERRTGLITSLYSAEEWAQGNRGIRCHLWLNRTATRSLKGAGPTGLPAG